MSDGDADDDSPDHDHRFEDLSVTAEDAATIDEASEQDSASEPDEASRSGKDATASDEDIDAWEWNDPESTAAASESTAAASESTAAASESTAAASESTAAASESTAAASESTSPNESDSTDPQSHGPSAGESASTPTTRRTGTRIWNRSPSNNGDTETSESSSAAAPAESEAEAPAPDVSESASTPVEGPTPDTVEGSRPNTRDSSPHTSDSKPSTDTQNADDSMPNAGDATPDATVPADTDTGSAFSPEATGGATDTPDAESPIADLDPAPGTSILLQCSSQDDREDAACHDLLGLDRADEDRNVLFIQYRRLAPGRLEHIAAHAARTTVVAVGYSQRVPESVADSVETIEINNPNDITRLGILVSGMLDDWADHDATTVVCYDSVNVLLEYKDGQSMFRFLHVFLSTLESADAIAHFHADPLAGSPQNINTIKPLFDDVVSIDSMGVSLE